MHSSRNASFFYAALAFGYGCVGLFLLWPLPRHLLSAIPGDGFDGWQNLWNLWWIRQALLELGVSPWFTPLLDYPAGASLLFHTLNFPNGILALPVYEALGPYAAYNFIALLSFSLGGLGVALLALRVLGRTRRSAAVFAGCIFAFSPFHIGHLLGHMQVFAFQWLPFTVLLMFSAWQERKARTEERRLGRWSLLFLAVLFGVLAALVDWYNLVYVSLFWLIYGASRIVRLVRAGWRHLAEIVVLPVLQLAGIVLACAPLLVPMVAEALEGEYMRPKEGEVLALSADLMAYVLPQEMHPLWGKWTKALLLKFWPVSTAERMISFGYVPSILAVLGWWRGSRRCRPFALVALVFVLLSLGPTLRVKGDVISLLGHPLPLPYALLSALFPWLEIARSLSRYSVMALLSVAIAAAEGLHLLCRDGSSRWKGALFASGLVMVEFFPGPYPISPPDTPGWYAMVRSSSATGGAILNLPVNWDRPRYLLYQLVHGRPLISGYTSRRNPLAPVELYPGLQQLRALGDDVLPLPDAPTFATIAADLGLEYVVIDGYQMAGEEQDGTLRIAQHLLQGQECVFQDDRLQVYHLRQPDRRRSYVALYGKWGALRTVSGVSRRSVCSTCGLLVRPAPGCSLAVQVKCASGAVAVFEAVDASVILLEGRLRDCSEVVLVDWYAKCSAPAAN